MFWIPIRSEVTGVCEQPDVHTGNQTFILCKNIACVEELSPLFNPGQLDLYLSDYSILQKGEKGFESLQNQRISDHFEGEDLPRQPHGDRYLLQALLTL